MRRRLRSTRATAEVRRSRLLIHYAVPKRLCYRISVLRPTGELAARARKCTGQKDRG